MSAKASGSNAQPNGDTKHRQHTDGSETRSFTPEQKAEVIRIRKCSPTAFYEILAIEKTSSDGQIKKAYRKISLLTHPDKNGYAGADEAFKMVSRAFQILSDTDKKAKYDRFGGDPDSRFPSSNSQSSSPFGGGFARSPGAGMGGQNFFYEDEISPEELFNRFFGGGGGMGGAFPFGAGFGGQQFVFNMGGGPGFRVHQMGGGMPRRRPAGSGQTEQAPQGLAAFTQLIPLLLIFILPLLSSLFTGGTTAGPSFRFDSPQRPYTMHRVTPNYKVDYFVNPKDVDGYTDKKFRNLDKTAEVEYVTTLQYQCEHESQRKRQAIADATGFFFTDEAQLRAARAMAMPACERLDGLRRR
ncbi:Chaperone protein dnaJ [Lithohypha guttulata]|uniref:Chaperone protein dnaJ n=1 Tax=Lithohypha guttulata TaxID=1690604 RepID=UPI002DE0222F|nr:Chaperone protein dnaJ [Lithohypha guttulata]KAK5096787.1 Chaperone protein dnaJ [Lithohypha guttulata]